MRQYVIGLLLTLIGAALLFASYEYSDNLLLLASGTALALIGTSLIYGKVQALIDMPRLRRRDKSEN
jgi:hypothetical protein